jgi:hypothetical protein
VVLAYTVAPNTIRVASSAPLLGIIGGYMAQLSINWEKLEVWQRRINFSVCIITILITLCLALGPNYVDLVANLGALVMGIIIGFSIFGREYVRQNSKIANSILFSLASFVLFYFIILIVIFFFFVTTEPFNCDY